MKYQGGDGYLTFGDGFFLADPIHEELLPEGVTDGETFQGDQGAQQAFVVGRCHERFLTGAADTRR